MVSFERMLYDGAINAGLTPEQAQRFVEQRFAFANNDAIDLSRSTDLGQLSQSEMDYVPRQEELMAQSKPSWLERKTLGDVIKTDNERYPMGMPLDMAVEVAKANHNKAAAASAKDIKRNSKRMAKNAVSTWADGVLGKPAYGAAVPHGAYFAKPLENTPKPTQAGQIAAAQTYEDPFGVADRARAEYRDPGAARDEMVRKGELFKNTSADGVTRYSTRNPNA